MIRMSEGDSNQPTFKRGVDLLQTGDAVTTRQIVNVLGRWGSHRDWNDAIGRKGKLDELRSGDFYDDDVKALATDFSQPMEYYIPRRPQFLNFCERYGLVARWVHGENVGELPFTDAKLAASIGATIEELKSALCWHFKIDPDHTRFWDYYSGRRYALLDIESKTLQQVR